MDGKRRWFGWVAIGLGALALAVAILGRGFGTQLGAAGQPGAYAQQAGPGAWQQNTGPQAGPGAQQNAGPQAGRGAQQQQAGPGAQQNAGRQGGRGAQLQQNAGPQAGSAGPGGEMRRGGGRPGPSGFGMGGWLRMPFRLIGGSFQWVMLALLIGLGVWMLRGRNSVATSTSGRAEPAQSAPPAPLSPTGEAYTEEANDEE